MLLLPEGASDEVVGRRAILHSHGLRHAKMVGSTRATGGRVTTTLFGGLCQLYVHHHYKYLRKYFTLEAGIQRKYL